MELLSLLQKRFPFRGAEDWRQRIDKGWVTMDRESVRADAVVAGQARLQFYSPAIKEPAVADNIPVIGETEEWLAVCKPAPLPVHPGGRYNRNSLIHILREKGYKSLHVVHRLDKVTSGVMIFAKTASFANLLQHCFSSGNVRKQYTAFVEGVPSSDLFTVQASIRRKKGARFECKESADALEACTHFEVIERRGSYSVIDCCPETGRTHQLRLHLRHIGHPVVQDEVYGRHTEAGGADGKEVAMQNRPIYLFNNTLEFPGLSLRIHHPVPGRWHEAAQALFDRG